MSEFKYIELEVINKVAYATLNRPDKANALNHKLWFEIGDLAKWAHATPEVRALVLQGAGKHFTAGIDFSLIMQIAGETATMPEGHKQEALRAKIIALQDAFTALEQCSKPVIASIHGSCIGGDPSKAAPDCGRRCRARTGHDWQKIYGRGSPFHGPRESGICGRRRTEVRGSRNR